MSIASAKDKVALATPLRSITGERSLVSVPLA